MDYLVEGSIFSLSYRGLREDYLLYKAMPDAEFTENAIKILHFTCIVCYMKEISAQSVLSDKGIIHELVHLLDANSKDDALRELPKIREKFNRICELA